MVFDQAPDGTLTQVTLQPADLPTWSKYVSDFDNAVTQTQQYLQDLEAETPPTAPAALADYNGLVSDGQSWLARLQQLQSMRDSVSSWATGLYQGAVDFTSRNIIEPIADVFTAQPLPTDIAPPTIQGLRGNQLGIVPLVIAGVGLAAFAAVVYGALQWVERVQRFNQLNQMAQACIANGGDSTACYQQAARTLNYTAGAPGAGGLLQSLGQNIIWAAAAVVFAVWLLPKVLDRIGGGK